MRTTILLLLLALASGLRAQTLTVNVTGIRSSKGSLRISVFINQEGFKKEKPLLVKTVKKDGMQNGKISLALDGLKPGIYGVALLDDENNNQEMDYGLVMPKEGFGFSDYYHTGMTRPVFGDFDFSLGSQAKAVEIRIRYL